MKRLLLVIGALGVVGFIQSPSALPMVQREAPLTATLISTDGISRSVTLEGVGCEVSMCSRVVIKGKAEDGSLMTIPLDTLIRIKDSNQTHAVLVRKDGSEQRLALIPNFRVLYFTNPYGASGKVDLLKVKSMDFVARAH